VEKTSSRIGTIAILLLFFVSVAYAGKKNAALAMALCVVPGGGQFYTERYVPGVAIGAAEVILGYYIIKYHREDNYSKRNSMLWWGALVLGFSLADAYVGAKMHGFDVDADIDKVSLAYKWRW
jgi:hypothetical protein